MKSTEGRHSSLSKYPRVGEASVTRAYWEEGRTPRNKIGVRSSQMFQGFVNHINYPTVHVKLAIAQRIDWKGIKTESRRQCQAIAFMWTPRKI